METHDKEPAASRAPDPVVDKPPDETKQASLRCPTCGATAIGTYCHQCGEKVGRGNDPSLWHFVREAAAALTNTDNKLFRSFRALVLKPGRLTTAYMAGRRVPYLPPFRLFLVANVLFFLTVSITGQGPFTTRLRTHIESGNFFHRARAERMVTSHLETTGTSFEVYEEVFNRRVNTLSKTLVLVMIPLFALLMKGVFIRRRRAYFVKHLVFSFHFYAYLMLLVVFFGWMLALLVEALKAVFGPGWYLWFRSDSGISLLLFFMIVGYLFFALRRAFDQKIVFALATAFLLSVGMYYVLLLYRALLFFITFYTI
ncbi:MAG: DUF3667 domain-containing protein [Bacteroidetes bacterium]|nr:DUF3667 domain-containing protein [Bacteroidota bacterium]